MGKLMDGFACYREGAEKSGINLTANRIELTAKCGFGDDDHHAE